MRRGVAIVVVVATFAATFAFACSSTDPAPAQPASDDGGPSIDAGNAIDAATDAPAEASGPPTMIEPRGGARVAAQYAVTSDGANVFYRMFDKMLGVPCDFVRLGDGRFRCVPTPAFWSPPVGAVFEDVDCTKPAIDVPKGCTPPVIMRRLGAATQCPSTNEVRAVGALLSTTRSGSPGSCVERTAPTDFEPHAVGDAIPDATYVSYVEETRSVGGGVAIRMVVGDDGSDVAFFHFMDEKSGKACVFANATDGTTRCIPMGEHTDGVWADSTCATRASYPEGCNEYGFPRDESVINTPWICRSAKLPVYARGAAVTGTLYVGTPTMCLQMTADSQPHYLIGAELSPSAYPLLVDVPRGGARIEETVVIAGGHMLRRWIIRDKQLDHACMFTPAADGKVRCLPTGDGVRFTNGLFADAACTEPLVRDDAGCAAPTYVMSYAPYGCAQLARVRSIGAALDASATIYSGRTGACEVWTPAAGESVGTYHRVGAEVDPSVFAEASVVDR